MSTQQIYRIWDLIDCKDSLGFWCVGRITNIDKCKSQIRVHYMRWSNSWDEWISVPTGNIAPLGSHRLELNHPGMQKILSITQQYQRQKYLKAKGLTNRKRARPTSEHGDLENNSDKENENNSLLSLIEDNDNDNNNKRHQHNLEEIRTKILKEIESLLIEYGQDFCHNQYSWLFHLCDLSCGGLILKYWKCTYISPLNKDDDDTKKYISDAVKQFYVECRTLDSKREHLLLNVFFTFTSVDEVIEIIISLMKDNEVRLRHRWVFALADMKLLTPSRADYILTQTPLSKSCQLFSTQRSRTQHLHQQFNNRESIAGSSSGNERSSPSQTFVSSPISMENFVGFWCNYFEILGQHGANLINLLNLFHDDYIQSFTTSKIRQKWCKKFLAGTNTYKFLNEYEPSLRDQLFMPDSNLIIPNDVWSVIDDFLQSTIICPFE